jgi:hypothetical protein
LASNLGTLMQSVGAAWLMGDLGASPAMVALVQTATFLPVFLVGIPAGVLADLFDRRRLLLGTQMAMMATAFTLAALTFAGTVTPAGVLALTFALGAGAALNGPAWMSIQPDLVPKHQFGQAVALGSMTFNVGRAVGPAIGGLIVALTLSVPPIRQDPAYHDFADRRALSVPSSVRASGATFVRLVGCRNSSAGYRQSWANSHRHFPTSAQASNQRQSHHGFEPSSRRQTSTQALGHLVRRFDGGGPRSNGVASWFLAFPSDNKASMGSPSGMRRHQLSRSIRGGVTKSAASPSSTSLGIY